MSDLWRTVLYDHRRDCRVGHVQLHPHLGLLSNARL